MRNKTTYLLRPQDFFRDQVVDDSINFMLNTRARLFVDENAKSSIRENNITAVDAKDHGSDRRGRQCVEIRQIVIRLEAKSKTIWNQQWHIKRLQ